MVHLRLNAKDVSPNPHVNFITSLTASVSESEDAAKQLLCALAAQVKPIMKKHGFVINSLEEVRDISRLRRHCSRVDANVV